MSTIYGRKPCYTSAVMHASASIFCISLMPCQKRYDTCHLHLGSMNI